MTQKLENNITEVLTQQWEFDPYIRLPSQRLCHWKEESQEHLLLQVSRTWVQELHRTGRNKDSTLGGHTEDFTYIRTQCKANSIGDWLTNLQVSESFLISHGSLRSGKTLAAKDPWNNDKCQPSQRPSLWHQDLTLPHCLQALVLPLFNFPISILSSLSSQDIC